MKGVTHREDPHAVLDDIRPYVVGELGVIPWIPNAHTHLTSSRYLGRLLLALVGDCRTVYLACGMDAKRIVMREFSNASLLLFLPMYWVLRKRLVLNINHNISRPGGLWLVRLAQRIGVRFALLCGFELRGLLPGAACPDVAIRATKREAVKSDNVALILTGTRAEQSYLNRTEMAVLIDRIEKAGLCPAFLSRTTCPTRSMYLQAISAARVVVVIYDPRHYANRHSGVVWDLLLTSTCGIVPASNVTRRQIVGNEKRLKCYSDKQSLLSLIEQVREVDEWERLSP